MTHRRTWKRAGIVLGVWTAVGLFRALERWTIDPVSATRLEFGFREALSQNLLFSYLWAAFTPLVAHLARRFPISGRSRARTFGVHFAASALVATAHGTLFALVYPPLMGVPFHFLHQLRGVPSILTVFLLANLLTYWGVLGICWTIEALRLSRERELRASQLEAQLAAARLERLKTQLHPHFLFNALNSVLPLVFRDRDAAATTVLRLEELLRRSLEADAAQLVPLSRELEFLEMYLEIQKTRFQDRLRVAFDVPSELVSARVPNLILQPLVENAIKHGVSTQPGAGRVAISARREDGMLVLKVRDDGPGLTNPPRTGAGPGSGLGLANTRERLRQLYGDEQRLDLVNMPEGGLEVRVALPLSAS
ncbi:MAG TPA: histidine kinase [Thermoanaerobaculia bacterium]|nr:histidine kinase [Thermoanaerobaculia bacterium]